jgi:hypothetical protein
MKPWNLGPPLQSERQQHADHEQPRAQHKYDLGAPPEDRDLLPKGGEYRTSLFHHVFTSVLMLFQVIGKFPVLLNTSRSCASFPDLCREHLFTLAACCDRIML